jgi:hypothetical protein
MKDPESYRREWYNPACTNVTLELRLIHREKDIACEVVDVETPTISIMNFVMDKGTNERTAKGHAYKLLNEAGFAAVRKSSWKPVQDKLNKVTHVKNNKRIKHPLISAAEAIVQGIDNGTIYGFHLTTTYPDGLTQTMSMNIL